MPRKGSSKKAPAAPPSASTLPDASPLANEARVKKRGCDFADTEDIPGKKTRQNNNPPPCSPLPKCRGRNEDPVGIHAKAVKAAETKAAKEAKEVKKRRKVTEAEAAKEGLAEVEADKSFVEVQEQRCRIRRQSDMKVGASDGNSGTEDGDDVNSDGEELESVKKLHVKNNKKLQTQLPDEAVTNNGGEELETDNANTYPGKKHGSEKKKKERSKLRDEIVEKKHKIKAKRGVAASASEAQDGVGATVASGLNTAWLRKQKSRKRHAVEVAEKMDDEAALSIRPDFPPSPKFDRKAANNQLAKANLDKRNPARKNMLVSPVSEDSDDSDSDSALSVTVIHRPVKPCMPSSKQGKQIMKPIDQGVNKPRLQKKLTQQGSDASIDSPPDRGCAAIMPKGSNSLSLLSPVLSSLKAKYLAMLFNALYASEEPFDHFVKTSSTFLKISRWAFENVWPHLKITVETDDVLFSIGYQCILEKRGKIHDAVKESVEQHFLLQKYSVTEIVNWVKWFCSTHGSPVFYETPVPQDGVWDGDSPDYKKPCGFLKSKFLISVGSRFFQDIQDTAYDFGPPRGLFVLILTAISHCLSFCSPFQCSWSTLQYEKVVRSY